MLRKESESDICRRTDFLLILQSVIPGASEIRSQTDIWTNLYRMKRKIAVLLTLVIIGFGIAIYIKGDDRYSSSFYNPLLELPLDTIVERGIEYVYTDKQDSALAYFGVVAGQYNESMSQAEKMACAQAFNCKGYVELFNKRLTGEALMSLMKAEQIEREANDSTWLPLIYLNMANAYTYANDADRVIKLNRRAADLAWRHKAWRTYLTAFRNLAFEGIMENDVAAIKGDLDRFSSLKIPDANMRGFAQCLHDGGRALLEKRWDDAYVYFQKADSLNDAELTPDRSHFMSVLLRSRVHQLREEPRLAIREIEENLPDFKDEQVSSAYLILSRLYDSMGDREQGARCRLRYYENSDSLGILTTSGQLSYAESQFQLNNMTGEVSRLNARRKTWITIASVCAISALVLAAALIAVIISRRRLRKSQDQLYLKNKTIIDTPAIPQTVTEDQQEARHIMETLENSKEIFEMGFSIEKAAALTGIHSRRISKILNSAFGKNFNTVLQELRIRKACRMLESPDTSQSLNMGGIASSLGFKSRTYFSEVFKKQTGLTPTEYLRSAKRAEK